MYVEHVKTWLVWQFCAW